MKSYLPTVKPETSFSIAHTLSEHYDEGFAVQELERIASTNPKIAEFILNFAGSSKDPLTTAYCALIVYRLLESQAEADAMNTDEFYTNQT